jgi:phosphatidylinositol glycan class B
MEGPRAADNGKKALSKTDEITVDAPKQSGRDVLLFLIAFRIVNALCVATFFQPDEYFQSLEPAWDSAFGSQSGAWITWVC